MGFGVASGWYSGLATDLDSGGRLYNAFGHNIESTICYITPWDTTKGFTNTPTDWVNRFANNPSQLRPFYFDLMVPWAVEAVPKRDMQIVVDIAPTIGSATSGGFGSAGTEDVTRLTNWHTDINNGLWDAAYIAFANMLVAAGLANTHVRIFHEPAEWNCWTASVDFAGWVNAFNRQVSIYRSHGLTGRMGPSWSSQVSANLTTTSWPLSDTGYYDTYDNDLNTATKDAWATRCRTKGLLVNLSEVGILTPTSSNDAQAVTFFTSIHDYIQRNTDIFDGIVVYNGNTSADFTTGGFPNTLAYIRNNMPTWEVSAAPGGSTGTNTAAVVGSLSTAMFSGTCASNVVNITVYRDTYGGTKLSDITPSAGAWSYNKTSETNGAHVYVVAMFDSAAGVAGNLLFTATFNLTIDNTAPVTISDRATRVTASGTNGSSIGGLTWPSGGSAPQSGDTAILAIAIGSGGTSPQPTGFGVPKHRADNSTQVAVAIYTYLCTGTETGTITISNAGLAAPYGLMHASLHVKTNVDQTTPIDVIGTPNTGANSTTISLPSVTTTKANVLGMQFAMAVSYGSASTFTWTPPGTLTELTDVFGLEGGLYGKSLQVCEHNYATAGATGANTTTYGTSASYLVSTAIGVRVAPLVTPTQSLTNITYTKDLGTVAINVGTVTSGIATVKVMDGGVLQGSATPTGGLVSVSLAAPQSVGSHTYTIGGYDGSDVLVAGPYFQQITVLAAPLIVGTVASVGNERISANSVTTVIRVYETVANGGALVTTHPVDVNGGWDFTTLALTHDYDTTAFDDVHESARVRFTTATAPPAPTTSIDSVTVDTSGVITAIWEGLSFQLKNNAGAVLDTVTTGAVRPPPAVGFIYNSQPGNGHYTVVAYNNAVPASATLSDSRPVDINVITVPVQTVTLVSASGTLLVSDASGKLIRIDIP